VGVNNADELAARLAEGYHRSIPEAAEAFFAAKAPKVATTKDSSVVADNAPPTRDEMLEQAARIGLKTDKRWSDATLLANIEAHMKGSK
jgi:predicted nucleic acid-binding protein